MHSRGFSKRRVVFRRLIELFLPSIIFSVLITTLNVSEIIVKRYAVVIMITAFVVIFTVYNFRNLRKCYIDMRNEKLYYCLNFLSHVIFATGNILVFLLASNEFYTWVFSITKGIAFLGAKTIISILLFHFIGLASVVIAPIGMEWVFEIREKREI